MHKIEDTNTNTISTQEKLNTRKISQSNQLLIVTIEGTENKRERERLRKRKWGAHHWGCRWTSSLGMPWQRSIIAATKFSSALRRSSSPRPSHGLSTARCLPSPIQSWERMRSMLKEIGKFGPVKELRETEKWGRVSKEKREKYYPH